MTRLLTAVQVADRLGVHINTVKHIPASELGYYRLGTRGDRRYDVDDLVDYMRARRVGDPALRRDEVPTEPDNPPSDIALEPIAKGERCGAGTFDGLDRKQCRRPASFRREGLPVCRQHARLPMLVPFG